MLTDAQKKELPGMWMTGVNVFKTEGGLLALYGGYIPTIAGVAPYVSRVPDCEGGNWC
jgi:solute carrier family 25 phosphate transporter 23/24/25/41